MSEPSVGELYKIVLASGLAVDEKKAMLNEVRKLGAFTRDRWIFRWVVWILGATVLLGIMLFPLREQEIPDGVLALAATAVGALAAFLSPNLAGRSEGNAEEGGGSSTP